jgi:phage terminase large subunit
MSSRHTSSTQLIRVDVARALQPLLKPARYKGAYGGRGSGKSHFFAERVILRCFERATRVVCIREVQNTIRDSVRQLLVDKIIKLGLGAYFTILDNEIRGANGSVVIFRGMQSYNADSIKSLEGYDIVWVEEAQTLSQVSLELLRPTIRKDGSELWFSWNPRHRTDAVDIFFRKNPHPEAISVLVNWRDNPWFPEVLRREMDHDIATDPDAAEHVWEGGYGLQAGAILGRWVSAAEKQKRIHNGVAFDPRGPGVEVTSDLGWRDTADWWFWQRRVGGFVVLYHYGASGMDASDWIEWLDRTFEERQLPLGKIWLPHDARTRTFQSKHSAIEQFATHYGTRVGIVERTSIADRINAARTIIKRCEFHEKDCEKGLEGLRAWEFEFNPDLMVFTKEPKHNWASHPSDGYSYGCQVMQSLAPPPPPEKLKPLPTDPQTMDDLHKFYERKNRSLD